MIAILHYGFRYYEVVQGLAVIAKSVYSLKPKLIYPKQPIKSLSSCSN